MGRVGASGAGKACRPKRSASSGRNGGGSAGHAHRLCRDRRVPTRFRATGGFPRRGSRGVSRQRGSQAQPGLLARRLPRHEPKAIRWPLLEVSVVGEGMQISPDDHPDQPSARTDFAKQVASNTSLSRILCTRITLRHNNIDGAMAGRRGMRRRVPLQERGERYKTKAAAETDINSVRTDATGATVADNTG